MTRQLRILTGYHAGARLDLPPGRHVIGADEHADVHISDWQGAAVAIVFAEDGTVTLASMADHAGRDAAGVTDPVPLHDFIPVRRGDIVLCVGPADTAWPAEVRLLEAMFRPAPAAPPVAAAGVAPAPAAPAAAPAAAAPAASARRPRAGRRWLRIGVCALAATTAIGAAMAMAMTRAPKTVSAAGSPARAPALTPAQRRLAQVEHTLGSTGQAEVKAAFDHGPGIEPGASNHRGSALDEQTIVVSGMVPTAAEATALRRALAPLDGGHLVIRLSVAASIVDDLRASLSDPGAEVSYAGAGVFRVGGTVRDPARARALIERMRGDYGAAVRRIEVDLAGPSADNTPRNVHAALHVDGLRYYQLPDGTKNFPDDALTAGAESPEGLASDADAVVATAIPTGQTAARPTPVAAALPAGTLPLPSAAPRSAR